MQLHNDGLDCNVVQHYLFLLLPSPFATGLYIRVNGFLFSAVLLAGLLLFQASTVLFMCQSRKIHKLIGLPRVYKATRQ